MTLERRIGGLEVRAEGRRLSGTVLRFGDISPSHRERFEPGAFAFAAAVALNLSHDPERAVAWQPGGGLELRQDDSSLSMTATLPPIPAADRALAMVRSGQATGLSVEFKAVRERRDADIRVVEAALLVGIGLVRDPAYGGSRVEARRRGGRGGGRREPRTWVRGNIRYGVKAHCACLDGSCNEVYFRPEALEVVDSTLAITERASDAVGSAKGGTLRTRNTPEALEFEITDAGRDTAAGRQLEDLRAAGVEIYGRPIVDEAGTVFEDIEGVREYSKARVRAVLIKPVLGEAERQGWLPLEFPDPAPARRRSALWRL